MPKKYIQVLLSINFCLTAMTAMANLDSGLLENRMDISDKIETPNWTLEEYSNQFNQIWDCLEKINNKRPSKLLQNLIEQYNKDKPLQCDEGLEEISATDLENQAEYFNTSLEQLQSNYQTEEDLNTQMDEIVDCGQAIYNNFPLATDMSPKEKAFLQHHLGQIQFFLQNFISPLSSELNNTLYSIWDCLDKINTAHPSKLLEFFILRYKEEIKKPFSYDKLKDISPKELENQFNQLEAPLALYFHNQLKKSTDEDSQKNLIAQFDELKNHAKTIFETYNSKIESLSQEEKNFLSYQLGKLQGFLQNFISPVVFELSNQFQHIWNRLNKINNIHPSNLLKSLMLQHKENMLKLIPYNENPEGISKEELDNQFVQLKKSLKICSKYQFKEEIGKESAEKLQLQFNAIDHVLGLIHNIYISKKEPLSKEDQVFLNYRLKELLNFSQNLINLEIKLSPLSKTQELLEACQEEDLSIYAQYEPVINQEEVDSLEFLTDLETKKNFIYFNESEGLIEIQHQPDDDESYSTTWKIGKADMNFMKGWKLYDQITITKTGLFSKYSMSKYLLGESLEYTINNNRKTSVRANFVCKSSRENTYTILSIDYHENIVILKNGPCLFIEGDLNNWHIKDIVILQRTGSALNTEKSHQLINKTRTGTVSCSLKKKK